MTPTENGFYWAKCHLGNWNVIHVMSIRGELMAWPLGWADGVPLQNLDERTGWQRLDEPTQ